MRGFHWLKRRRPAPGTVLGLIALIVALAGTAVAGPLATTSGLKKKDKKQIRKIARAEIAKAAPGLTVGNATNSTNAANATNATNAGQVDGHDAVCPAGTFLQSGYCFDSADSGDSGWIGAMDDCIARGGGLPSIQQLKSIREVPGIDLGNGTGSNRTWSDSFYDGDTFGDAMARADSVVDNGTFDAELLASLRRYRCVFPLVR